MAASLQPILLVRFGLMRNSKEMFGWRVSHDSSMTNDADEMMENATKIVNRIEMDLAANSTQKSSFDWTSKSTNGGRRENSGSDGSVNVDNGRSSSGNINSGRHSSGRNSNGRNSSDIENSG